MANPLSALAAKPAVAGILARMKMHVVGLAEDFWKDGQDSPLKFLGNSIKKGSRALSLESGSEAPPQMKTSATGAAFSATNAPTPPGHKAPAIPTDKIWHAAPGEISEIMWGEGFLMPGGSMISDMLIKPLGLNKDMSLLDLSAGLGTRMRRTREEYGAYITGLEPDADIAARAMELSMRPRVKPVTIAHYDPAHFAVDRTYECIIARELFYRVADKPTFIKAIGACTKPTAQVAFTDYIVNPEDREKSSILAWRAYEKNATPMGLIESAEVWAKAGFHLRVHEDLSDFYRKESIKGLKRLAATLASGPRPDAETKQAILRRIELWMVRLTAMDQGMKFYRFYGTKG